MNAFSEKLQRRKAARQYWTGHGSKPAHARNFLGRAKVIPVEDTYFLGYQDDWIVDDSLFKLMEKSRRVGVSFGTEYESVRWHAVADQTLDSWVSSRDEPTAMLFVAGVRKFAKVLNTAAEDMGRIVLAKGDGAAHAMSFANGTTLWSVASNPDVFAGKGGRVVLDEFALRRDPRGVYAIAEPSTTWGGSMAIISTHRGSLNFFNALIREVNEKGNPKGFSLHRVTLEDALAQGFLWKLQTKLRPGDPRLDMDEADYFTAVKGRAADEESFQQEYMCVPGDDSTAFITWEMITRCSYHAIDRWEEWTLAQAQAAAQRGALLYGGLDIGRTNDLTAFVLLERVGDAFHTRRRITLQRLAFSEQEATLYPWFEVCRRLCCDQTGLGRQFTERAQQRFGEHRVEGVTFSGPVKEELAYPVRSAMEDAALRIPDDAKLHAAFRAIKKEDTAAGNVRFVADRGPDGHADEFWSYALGLHAGKSLTGPFSWQRVSRATSPDSDAGVAHEPAGGWISRLRSKFRV